MLRDLEFSSFFFLTVCHLRDTDTWQLRPLWIRVSLVLTNVLFLSQERLVTLLSVTEIKYTLKKKTKIIKRSRTQGCGVDFTFSRSTRVYKDHQLSPEASNGVHQSFSWVPKEKLALPSPRLQAFGLKCKRIKCCCLKPPNLWCVVSEAPGHRGGRMLPRPPDVTLRLLTEVVLVRVLCCETGHPSFLCCRMRPRSHLRSEAKRFNFLLLCPVLLWRMFSCRNQHKRLAHRTSLNLF